MVMGNFYPHGNIQPNRNENDDTLALKKLGYRMGISLSVLDCNEGHPIIEIATEEIVEPDEIDSSIQQQVLHLTLEWSIIEGVRPKVLSDDEMEYLSDQGYDLESMGIPTENWAHRTSRP